MSESARPAVVVDRVSKRFWLSPHRAASVKERVLGAGAWGSRGEALWALSDVSLTIPAGTTTGVIGPNGCGKSTLLQLIAGVLEPDGGRVTVDGRVTSLLELGAGFSPELTGRENVYLNASLHGVSRDAVRARFDAIVAYAELDRFIDMPVRTYSSGMYVRLGFAVAVHLDPEIVLIDEAFAVGDAHFQRKCLHTIRDFQRQGRTIVVVSHDLHLVEQLCTQVLLLQQGTVVAAGAPANVIGRYHELDMGRGVPGLSQRWGTGAIEITHVDLLSGGQPAATVRTRDALHDSPPLPLRRAGGSPRLRPGHPPRRRRARDRTEHPHERVRRSIASTGPAPSTTPSITSRCSPGAISSRPRSTTTT